MNIFKTISAGLSMCLVLLGGEISHASADEGMWMIQDIHEALEKNMQARGLRLSAGEIYNADAPGASISDAVVSLGFYCTGSVISSNGLIITNHHCAYANVSKLSTSEHNYLEDGFWAMTSAEEIPIEGESVYFLKKVIDVTEEYDNLAGEMRRKHQNAGSRKLSSILEKKYSEETGLEAILSSMWTGEKRYMSLYKVYTDLRLVAAPPLCIGYFGGDEDNWEWPRQNCDFALYRIYENGVPVNCQKSLKISLKGYEPGSFAMVIGYPGRTNRYSSASRVNYMEQYELPVTTRLESGQISIIRKWMNADPQVRMKYSDWFFGLCNAQENNSGLLGCLGRFRVYYDKEAQDDQLQDWIDGSDERRRVWGKLIPNLRKAYSESNEGERNKAIYRETLFRGTFISRYCFRAVNAHSLDDAKKSLRRALDETDPRVEKELLAYSLSEYIERLDASYFGPFIKRLRSRFGNNWNDMSEYLWDNSLLSSESKISNIKSQDEVKRDPLVQLFIDVSIKDFNNRNGQMQKWQKANSLEREYERALYWMRIDKDILQYPDANFTMRISYGTVGGYSPIDGTVYDWRTTTDGILEKYDESAHDFNLNPRQLRLLRQGRWGRWEASRKTMYVDFLTDNDITGGNSGSPVLDADGNLIGLAFDGNKESLASDVSYTFGYNKCINTDIRFVLWVLDRYAGMKRILNELTFVK
ncbi:MAG: S46 family peptidase [Bacteroidales bacterium]|nr:S46 family peptidase [Bacteroidales bacterium]MDY6002629.1 S46 family peptidase [Candidatus Cryptobacteroides sp.]